MKITAQKTNRKDYFLLYTALKLGNSRCFQHTIRVKANSKEEALSNSDNIKEFLKHILKSLA
jgi:hypothetical protein